MENIPLYFLSATTTGDGIQCIVRALPACREDGEATADSRLEHEADADIHRQHRINAPLLFVGSSAATGW